MLTRNQPLPSFKYDHNGSNPCPKVLRPDISSTSCEVGYFVSPLVEPGDPYGGREGDWTHHFHNLFGIFNHKWYFAPTRDDFVDVKSIQGPMWILDRALYSPHFILVGYPVHTDVKWKTFTDFSKVRFLCQICKHRWTSMHGMVMFYYKFDLETLRGEVRFHLTGQQCHECKFSESPEFETPMWYPEEVMKVMTNLYWTIASVVYKYDTPDLITERRHGRPRQQHIASGCQGCLKGICKPINRHT